MQGGGTLLLLVSTFEKLVDFHIIFKNIFYPKKKATLTVFSALMLAVIAWRTQILVKHKEHQHLLI
jgi:hypothetical protein